MLNNKLHKAKKVTREMASFFVPKQSITSKPSKKTQAKITVLIPTYKPKNHLYRLVYNITKWYKNVEVVIVDDATPLRAKKSNRVLQKVKELSIANKNIVILRTPVNIYKASALNFGLSYIFAKKQAPEIVITIDDDVSIQADTLKKVSDVVLSNNKIGAACTLALVKNKNKNLLTRLQGLEYHGFNLTKIADNGFLQGPLVMQGMLTAFRYKAIKQVNGFATDKLIEDYDITVRIKNAGWKVAIATNTTAWTHAPQTLGELWRQRIRWSYGGLIVLNDFWKNTRSVFQDILGHAVFLSLFILVILSLLVTQPENSPEGLILGLFMLAITHFIISFTFSLISLLTYRDRDKYDLLLKAALLPELVYTNLLNIILIGSYIFFVFNVASRYIVRHIPGFMGIQKTGEKSFNKLGYTTVWGTRNS